VVPTDPPTYAADGLAVWHISADFLADPQFLRAYRRGMGSGHHIARPPGSDADIRIEWRVHTLLWAAAHAARLDGDFVECGVNTGIFSLAICDYLDFNATGKSFYLFDTFAGIPDEQISDEERRLGRAEESRVMFSPCFEVAARNFAPYPRARLIRGRVPDTLRVVDVRRVCYLSLDMNLAEPELAAIEHFWDRLVPGAPVVLDDYGWSHYRPQKEAMDAFAGRNGVSILTLPTGQGLLLKPPR
jgi:hypothetical protein